VKKDLKIFIKHPSSNLLQWVLKEKLI
jgi:hypothetical protein